MFDNKNKYKDKRKLVFEKLTFKIYLVMILKSVFNNFNVRKINILKCYKS